MLRSDYRRTFPQRNVLRLNWFDLLVLLQQVHCQIPKEGASAAQQHIVTTCKAQSRGFRPEAAIVRGFSNKTLGISRSPAKHPKRPMKSQWETITTISSRDLRQFHWAVSHGLLSLKAFAFWQGIPIIPVKKKSGRTVFICILRCSDTFSISSRSMPKTVGLCLGLSLEPDNRTCYLDLPWSTSHNWLEKAWHGWLLLCILRPSAQQLNYTFCPGVGLLAHYSNSFRDFLPDYKSEWQNMQHVWVHMKAIHNKKYINKKVMMFTPNSSTIYYHWQCPPQHMSPILVHFQAPELHRILLQVSG